MDLRLREIYYLSGSQAFGFVTPVGGLSLTWLFYKLSVGLRLRSLRNLRLKWESSLRVRSSRRFLPHLAFQKFVPKAVGLRLRSLRLEQCRPVTAACEQESNLPLWGHSDLPVDPLGGSVSR